MKKNILLLAGCALILASCGNNDAEKAQAEKNKADSISRAAEVAQMDAKRKTDSMANAMNAMKIADSVANATKAADAKEHKSGTTHKETKHAPVTTPTVAPAQTGMKAHSDQSQTQQNKANPQQGGGMKAHSDQNHK